MTWLFIFFFVCAGFVSLALAMDRHQPRWWRSAAHPLQRKVFRFLGTSLLAAALGACWATWGGATGWVTWLGVLTVSALVVVIGFAIHSAFQR